MTLAIDIRPRMESTVKNAIEIINRHLSKLEKPKYFFDWKMANFLKNTYDGCTYHKDKYFFNGLIIRDIDLPVHNPEKFMFALEFHKDSWRIISDEDAKYYKLNKEPFQNN